MTVLYVQRNQWGARKPSGSYSTVFQPNLGGIVLHWQGADWDPPNHAACARLVRAIQQNHMDVRGFIDIAYNFLVCPHGSVFVGRGLDHRSAANHTTQANLTYYAVCLLVQQRSLTALDKAQVGMTKEFVTYLRHMANAGPMLAPHSAIVATECPGDAVRHLISTWGHQLTFVVPGEFDSIVPLRAVAASLTPENLAANPDAVEAMLRRLIAANPTYTGQVHALGGHVMYLPDD